MIINCIAVDDEPLALDIISDYIKKIPFLNLLKTFDNAMDTINFIKNNKIDLMFLDIQMDGITGIQLLNVLKQKPEVIFTTAYDSYALQSYDLDVADYLLKPISFERFMKSVDKVYEKIKLLNQPHQTNEAQPSASNQAQKDEFFFVKTEYRMQKINFADILFIEGQGDYLRIITKKEKIMTLQNFKNMEQLLPPANFIRVHRSYIIAIDKIESIERNRIKILDKLIPIGELYKKHFYDSLEKKQLL